MLLLLLTVNNTNHHSKSDTQMPSAKSEKLNYLQCW